MTSSLGVQLDGGFDDPVFQAQQVFRAVMNAMAHPGRSFALQPSSLPKPPQLLSPALGALGLTLFDHDTTVWCDAALAAPEVTGWLEFHTGTRIVDSQAAADFALIGRPCELPRLDRFPVGTAEDPDRSATILVDVSTLTKTTAVTVTGPGIQHPADVDLPLLTEDFIADWQANTSRFPLGVDLVFVGDAEVRALTRTTVVTEEVG